MSAIPNIATAALLTFIPNDAEPIVKSMDYKLGMRQFLLDYSTGAYTLMTTANRNRILLLTEHIVRLAQSASLIQFGVSDAESEESSSITETMFPARTPNWLRSLVMVPIKKTMEDYFKQQPVGEAKIAVIVALSQDQKLLIGVHCDALNPPDLTLPCKVAMFGAPRINPRAKITSWITWIFQNVFRDRKYIEALQPQGYHESILIDESGNIYEGTTTNLVVLLMDKCGHPVLLSAPKGTILEGTVLGLVKKACQNLSLEFRREFPKLDTIEHWKGAAILNAARIMSPVSTVYIQGLETSIPVHHDTMIALSKEIQTLLYASE